LLELKSKGTYIQTYPRTHPFSNAIGLKSQWLIDAFCGGNSGSLNDPVSLDLYYIFQIGESSFPFLDSKPEGRLR
jgi:hypothetical protein